MKVVISFLDASIELGSSAPKSTCSQLNITNKSQMSHSHRYVHSIRKKFALSKAQIMQTNRKEGTILDFGNTDRFSIRYKT